MEQIVKSILKQQGIEQIGLYNKEKDIWIYIKEEEVHFCTSTLASINRDSVELVQNLNVLTYSNGSFQIVKDNETFTNFVVFDKTNKILIQKEDINYYSNPEYYILQIIDNKNLLIAGKEEWVDCYKHQPSEFHIRYDWMHIVWDSFVIINEEYRPNFNLCYFVDNTIFIRDNNNDYQRFVVGLQKNKGIIYQGRLDYLWIHKNNHAEIVSFDNFSYSLISKHNHEEIIGDYLTSIVNIKNLDSGIECNYKVSNFINHADIEDNNTELNPYDDKRLFSNNYLVVPFIRCYGAFVLRNVEGDISAHTISFNDSYENTSFRSFRIQLINDIIKITGIYDGSSDVESFYYSITGCYLGSTCGKGIHYLFFTDCNTTSSFYNPIALKGILKIDENNFNNESNIKIIAQPIFENIEIIDEVNGLFKVRIRDFVKGESHVQLYSEKSGLIEYDGYLSSPHYSNFISDYDEPCDYYSKYDYPIASCAKSNTFQIYWKGEYTSYYGLLYLGEKVLDAYYDEIKGFDFVDDFGEQSDKSIIEKTKHYKPLCVIVCKDGLFGLFYKTNKVPTKEYDFIEPIFDYIRCEKIFKGNAYFRVRKNGKFGIISDSFAFNQHIEIEYDDVYFKTVVGDSCYFLAKKSGKVGALCTQNGNTIPFIFEEIDEIIMSGVISHNVLYNRNGEKIFSLENYRFIKTKFCDVFQSTESEKEYVFIKSEGRIIEYQKDENDENFLHVNGIKELFSIENEDFVEEEDYDGYDYEDDYNYERDTYYALGGDDYEQWKENGGDLDIMMEGMGF